MSWPLIYKSTAKFKIIVNMKKLSKLKLRDFSVMSETEMKSVIGGYDGYGDTHCPQTGKCGGSCSTSGKSGTCKTGPGPTYDCLCFENRV